MNTTKKLLPLFFAVVLVFIWISGAVGKSIRQELSQESTLEQILKRGTLRVGMGTFVPWAMKDKTGNFVGFEIDIARRLAKDMGVQIEFVPTKWSGIIPALLTGKFDVIIGGMGIRPERNLKVNFSIPYYYTGMSIVASKKMAPGYKKLSDFNKKSTSISLRIGTTAETAVRKYIPAAKLRMFDDESQATQELLNNRVHAMVASAPLPAFLTLKHPKKIYLPLEDNFTKEPIGFALRKGDVDTLNFFNNWIRVVHAEGWVKEKKHYWFETKDWEGLIH